MLYGGFDYSVDKKGRMFIPARLRDELGASFMICRGFSGKRCLCVYSYDEWAVLVEKIKQLPSMDTGDFRRFLFDGAFSVECDAQGRVLIPPTLREYACLQSDAHIIGMATNLEIWNSELWAEENNKFTPESIAEAMLGKGF